MGFSPHWVFWDWVFCPDTIVFIQFIHHLLLATLVCYPLHQMILSSRTWASLIRRLSFFLAPQGFFSLTKYTLNKQRFSRHGKSRHVKSRQVKTWQAYRMHTLQWVVLFQPSKKGYPNWCARPKVHMSGPKWTHKGGVVRSKLHGLETSLNARRSAHIGNFDWSTEGLLKRDVFLRKDIFLLYSPKN